MKTEIYNVEGIEIEVERASKNDIEAERCIFRFFRLSIPE